MLRGYRWQLIALILSGMMFVAVLGTRILDQPSAPMTVTATASNQISTPVTPTATPQSVISDTTAPAPVSEPITLQIADIDDGVTTYREGLIGQVQRLNPLLVPLNPVDRDISSLIFEGLVSINARGEPVPALARDWAISGDGRVYVFDLRDDVLWQDGTPFTADDVIYTLSLLQSQDFPGAQAQAAFWQTIEVERLGEYLVRFRLAQPFSPFLTNLAVGMLPEHALRGTTADQLAVHPFNFSPIGTGPYQLEALRTGSDGRIRQVDLRLSPTYRQRPEIQATPFQMSRVQFRLYDTFDNALQALRRGEIDGLATDNVNQRLPLINVEGMATYTNFAPRIGLLIFNWDEAEDVRFFQDQRVRQALLTGINRIAPVENYLSNRAVVADSPLMPNSWAYANIAYPATDPDAARTLFESARILTGDDNNDDTANETEAPLNDPSAPRYRFNILVPDDPALVGIADEIAAQWQQYNLQVEVEALPLSAYETRLNDGDFLTAIVELPMTSDPDVYAYWHVGQHPDGRNYGGAADDRISETLERARRDPVSINRAQLYRQFQELFLTRSIAIPLYYPLFTYVVREDIEGVQLGFVGSPEHRLRTIGSWFFR